MRPVLLVQEVSGSPNRRFRVLDDGGRSFTSLWVWIVVKEATGDTAEERVRLPGVEKDRMNPAVHGLGRHEGSTIMYRHRTEVGQAWSTIPVARSCAT